MGDKKRTTNKIVEIDDKLCFISNSPTSLFILCVVYKPLLIKKNECKLKSDKQANVSQTCQRDETKANYTYASRDQLTVKICNNPFSYQNFH